MNIRNTLVTAASRILSANEREAVLGDLEESGSTSADSIAAIFSLFLHRRLEPWRSSWRPWIALFILAIPSSFTLMGISVGASMTGRHLLHPANRFEINIAVISTLGLFVWSWTSGFVLASLSRRTLWASFLAILSPCLFCFMRFRIPSLPRVSLLFFLLPAALGVIYGLRRPHIRLPLALALAISATLLMLPIASSGIWLFNGILIWPAWHIAVTAYRYTVHRT